MFRFKRLLVFVGVITLGAFGTATLVGGAGHARSPKGGAAPGLNDEGSREYQQKLDRQRQYLRYHSDPSGKPRPDLVLKGVREVKRMDIAAGVPVRGRNGSAPSSALTGVQWTNIGPRPLVIQGAPHGVMGDGPDSGEVVDIAVDPRNTN